MSDEPVVTLSLTQREVNALFIVAGRVSGYPDRSMRGVFSSQPNSFRRVLYPYITDGVDTDTSLRCDGSVMFKDGIQYQEEILWDGLVDYGVR